MARSEYCTFHLAGLFLGIEVDSVQEIVRFQELTRVPLAPAHVAGLINLRGRIVTAIDLRRRLDLADRPDGERPMNMILRGPSPPVGLLVDAVGDVLKVSAECYESTPANCPHAVREILHGVYKLQGRLLLALEVGGLIAGPGREFDACAVGPPPLPGVPETATPTHYGSKEV